MDASVESALKKWPNVPACYTWLALDARGDWYMRDEKTQALGEFPQSKGSRIEHLKLREFIERNYGHDDQGAWYFQNGPQRVYVDLEAAPWVWRITGDAGRPASMQVHSHTGRAASVTATYVDEHGRLFADTDLGLGIVHTQDMDAAADMVQAGLWQPEDIAFEDLLARAGVQRQPRAR